MTTSDANGRNTTGTLPSSLIPPSTGVLPVLPPDDAPDKAPAQNAATGASAAGVRALTSQAVAFYFRAPVKAFFRTRVDYLAYARVIQQQESALRHAVLDASRGTAQGAGNSFFPWLRSVLRGSTPGVLATAVRYYGWQVIPNQVLPPLIANVGAGAVLYTSYLQILGRLHEGSARASKRVYPPPQPIDTFAAGFLAGAIQSVFAAPLDAVHARYDLGHGAAGMTGSGNALKNMANATVNGNGAVARPQSMWSFGYAKVKEIGVRGVFAGWGLSFLKDSLGNAIFFSTFEYLKAQGYYRFVTWYYGSLNEDTIVLLSERRPSGPDEGRVRDGRNRDFPTIIKPHYAIEPAFLLLAGVSASVAQQVILHPLTHVQVEHWERLETIDAQARKIKQASQSDGRWKWRMVRTYYNAYQETWAQCLAEAEGAGVGLRRWLYRGFWWNTIRQVPSTSAGLIIFELFRRKYGSGGDQVKINRDGYDILLR
ncbi:mitochondrial carrier [Coniochaeta ligniaria NRRL 30616]|uniref:Mitochondrial carrier n=1 Tax=Coniochaeta ligniaria NRRL 30616 TaxID=1408157 RepID=A0A1J7IHR1_9PEZI|nr:mitochondrial carrier [Coniochaeta ligniaria NRRL 30616]